MRKYVLRSPETDRALVNVPDHAYGYGASPTLIALPDGTGAALGLAPTTVTPPSPIMYKVTNGEALGFTLQTTGLYLVTVRVRWQFSAPGSVTRTVGVARNGSAILTPAVTSTVGADTTDYATLMFLFEAGESISGYAFNTNGGGGTQVISSNLAICCLNA